MELVSQMNLFVMLRMLKRTDKYERTEGICCECMRKRKRESEREGFASHSTVICPLGKKNKGQKIQHEQSSCLVTIATERLLSYLAIHYERALVDRVRVGKGGERGRKRERGRQTDREREEGIFSVLVAGKWSETGMMIQRTDVKYILNRKKKYIEKKNDQTL